MQKEKLLNNKKLTLTLFVSLFIISLILTAIQTGFVLKNDYDSAIKTVKSSIKQVENSYAKTISLAIWQLDNSQLDIVIQSILKLPGITYIEIRQKDATTIKSGTKNKKYIIEDSFSLTHKSLVNTKLGTVYLQGSYQDNIDKILQDLKKKIFIEIVKVFTITFILIFLVQRLIIRHLIVMAKYTQNLDAKKLSVPLRLNKKKDENNPDSIDIVVDAINTMRKNLIHDIDQQIEIKASLELSNIRLTKEVSTRRRVEQEALQQKERILKQYNTIVKITLEDRFFNKSLKDGIFSLLKECTKTLDVDRVSFWVLEGDEKLKCTYRYLKEGDLNIDDNSVIATSKLTNFISYIKEHRIIDSSDVYTDERTKEYNHAKMKIVGVKSMLDVCVNYHSNMYGIIVFDTLKEHKIWTQDEISFVSRISDQVSNLLLVNEWKKTKQEISELNNGLELIVQERTHELKKNIENLKFTQAQLVESEKMASLGGLVAGVAHEINTPVGISLTGITHFQHITHELKELYESDNLSQKEFETYIKTSYDIAEATYKSLTHAAHLIRSFKQVVVDQSHEQIRDFNVYEYIEEVFVSLHSELKKTKHHVSIKCDKKLHIRSYPGSFSQILTNFIMNSLIHGFTDTKEGKINIEVKKIDDNIEMIYEDNGVGIDQENLQKIFDPFFTTNRENGGSGLGLNIVYNIVTNGLKGTIKSKSEKGSGTKFIIVFPIKKV